MERWEDERFRVPFLSDDVRSINEQLLLAVGDTESGAEVRKLLQVGRAVTRRLAAANANAVGTAIRCGVPLVSFSPVVEKLLCESPRVWRPIPPQTVPQTLQELTYFTLIFARQLARRKDAFTRAYFGLTSTAAENLGQLALIHVQAMSRKFGVLLRLREGERADVWADLLVGDRAVGPAAYQIAQETIWFSLRGIRQGSRGETMTSRARSARSSHGTQSNNTRGR